jgi:hypothetical protein
MALTSDIKIVRYGTADGHELDNFGLGSGVTVYRGSIALTAAATGYLKNAASPASTDVCWGLIDSAGPGVIDGGPGITNSGAAGAVLVQVATGTFFLGSSTGSDQLGLNTLGSVVYVYNENTVAATSGGSTRPAAGVHIAIDTTGQYPGGYAIRLGNNQSTGGH